MKNTEHRGYSLPASTGAWILAAALLSAPLTAAGQGLFEEAVSGSQQQDAQQPEPAAEGQEQDSLFEQAVAESKAPVAAPAEDPAKGAGLSASLGGFDFELNGYVRGDLYLGKYPDKDAAEVKSGYGEAALILRARKGHWGDAYGEIRLRGGYEAGEVGVHPDLREAYINLYLGPVDIRLGHQVIAWGRADAVNPTNNLTPRDMRVRSPNEDDARSANLALRAHLNLEPFVWEVVWLPFYAPSHLPVFNLPGGINIGDPQYPDANLKNGTIATRAHLLFSAVELSISYLIGTATFPGVKLLSASMGQGFSPVINVALATYRQQVVGADFSTAVSDWFGLRGEVAARFPFGYETYEQAPLPDVQYVLGLDREFFRQLNVTLQYNGRVVLDWDAVPDFGGPTNDLVLRLVRPQIVKTNRMIAGQTERVQHSLTLRLEWKVLQETLRLELLGMVNISTEEVMLRPRVAYDIADAITVQVGAEIYFGPEGTLFGTVEETQSAGFVEAKISF